MSIYLNKFENHTQYENYINSNDVILPNVSICTTEGEVYFNPWVETRVVAKYNVTDTSNPIKIGFANSYYDYMGYFSAIEIDGVELPSVISEYTFNTTGEHTVKYTLTDPTSIGDSAFHSCRNLTSIDIPDSVTSIGQNAFNSCYGLISIDIPDSVTNIGISAFSGCSSLTSINIPSGITSISNGVFRSCFSLTSIDIPDSVTSIGSQAFRQCANLTSITIPSGVTSIDDIVFFGCTSLTSIVSNAMTAPTISNDTFRNIATNGTLTVPSGSTGYDTWMQTDEDYLGYYNWSKVEQ